MTTPTALAAGVHPDDIPALLERIAELLAAIDERDRRIRAQAAQIQDLRTMLLAQQPRPAAEWCEMVGWEGLL